MSALATLLAPPLSPPPPPPLYTGSFYAAEAAAGVVRFNDAWAPAVDVGVRASAVLQLADVAARYAFSAAGDEQQHAVSVSGQLHPFLFFMLGSDRLWTTLASTYVRLGLGAGYLTGGPGVAALWDWGAGVDTPITDPDDGDSLWLGFEYRRTSTLDDDALGDPPLQTLLLRAGYRFNAL